MTIFRVPGISVCAALLSVALRTCGFAQTAPHASSSTDQDDSGSPPSPRPCAGRRKPRPQPPTTRPAGPAGPASAIGPQEPFHVVMPHSHNPFDALHARNRAPSQPTNSPRLQNLIREGKLYISLQDAIALALENNLDLASFRYNFPIER